MAAVRRLLGTVIVGVVMCACASSGSDAPQVTAAASTTTGADPTTAPLVATTGTAATSTSPPPHAAAAVQPSPAPTLPTTPAALDRAGDARQAVVVTAPGYGSTTATLSTWQRAPGGGWAAVHGPWTAFVGRAGMAPPGEKREGDGRTPSGAYDFPFLFGVQPDPGVALPYRRINAPAFVWVDDPASPSYNLLVDTSTQDPGGHGEAMFQTPAYDYGAVIGYNADRAPGRGSAIFLHVSVGAPTAGCVSLPADRLLEVFRWLDPAAAPVIVMGVS